MKKKETQIRCPPKKKKDTKSIHRNNLHFYILTVKNHKEKLRNQSHSPLQQKKLNIYE